MPVKSMKNIAVGAIVALSFHGCDPDGKQKLRKSDNTQDLVEKAVDQVIGDTEQMVNNLQDATNEGVDDLLKSKVVQDATNTAVLFGQGISTDMEAQGGIFQYTKNLMTAKNNDQQTETESSLLLRGTLEDLMPSQKDITDQFEDVYSQVKTGAAELGLKLPSQEKVHVLVEKQINEIAATVEENIPKVDGPKVGVPKVGAKKKTIEKSKSTQVAEQKARRNKVVKYGLGSLGAVFAGAVAAAAYGHYMHDDPKHLFTTGAAGVTKAVGHISNSVHDASREVGAMANAGLESAKESVSGAYATTTDYFQK